jgi:hypothetical protein
VAVRSFKGSTSNKRSMDRKTADALKREKAAQKKVDERSDRGSADRRHENG